MTDLTTVLRTDDGVELVATSPEHAGDGAHRISVEYSSLNYKDAMALAGDRAVARILPLVPGIDAVGRLDDGQLVTVNGAGLGERRHGGYTPTVNVDAFTVVPKAFDAFTAAAIGTAGYTAALSVDALRAAVAPSDGPVLVTGATGGVGSIAILLLRSLGYDVAALTGRVDEHGEWLRTLGASEVLDRADFAAKGRPLQKARFAGAVDTVGSHVLVNTLAQIRWGGSVTACGLAQGADLPGTVLPFILRGVNLLGINSVDAPDELREKAWALLAEHLDAGVLATFTEAISLEQVADAGEQLLAGTRRGRTVVAVR
ncbi:acrylyl-CoA reductase family protein [Corynebacterium uterequi]|uniref:Putative quinone oxidoreductase, YhdH/YhfP family n=1 Tax=Corynebacterium uterequi TaxID=1072256 RepID=A0A0G3HM31_9CORY|nr:acryloyl-CoA reductase [Corynebacterium uterequi]AKK12157.1 putative quinone oxidoreductase, YhdH/YhfP family [Corynebacterium uterequi]